MQSDVQISTLREYGLDADVHRWPVLLPGTRTGGVYACFNFEAELLYVGRTTNFARRMRQHGQRYADCTILHHPTSTEAEAWLLERYLIRTHVPLCNRASRTRRAWLAKHAPGVLTSGSWLMRHPRG